MHPYPTWKYISLIVAIVLGALYSAPNLYGEDPAVQISLASGDPLEPAAGARIDEILKGDQLPTEHSAALGTQWLVRFDDEATQLKAADALKAELGQDYVVALNLAPKTPDWLKSLGAKPMALGLDLRGGVHFLIEVDIDDVRKKNITALATDLPSFLRKEGIRYSGRRLDEARGKFIFEFSDPNGAEKVAAAKKAIGKEFKELALVVPDNAPLTLEAGLSEAEQKDIQQRAIEQNLITLRNRVNQFGVAEPVVQRQGANRIVVQLPGVQDPGAIIDLLGATATLEYRAVDEGDAATAAATGIIPPDTELFYHRDGHRPYLLKKEIIAAGSQLTGAASTVDENGQPAVSVTLDGSGAKKMFEFTSKNLNKPMAVLFRERKVVTTYNAKREAIRSHENVEEIISVASIRGVFGKRFQTTGLSSKEAHDLSILLKAGALAAPIDIIEERTIGPSLGADNVRRGFQAACLGLFLVAVFMTFYYRVFGLFAIAALSLNLLLLVAGLSLFGATLSMPGIAGIVLTMGIAVDANVLIYERIREDLRNGMKPHEAIEAGYDRAFLTIADANVTVLIGTAVLFLFGEGPVKGFAVTLALGIIASQYTAIIGSRALAQLVFEKRKVQDLPIW